MKSLLFRTISVSKMRQTLFGGNPWLVKAVCANKVVVLDGKAKSFSPSECFFKINGRLGKGSNNSRLQPYLLQRQR